MQCVKGLIYCKTCFKRFLVKLEVFQSCFSACLSTRGWTGRNEGIGFGSSSNVSFPVSGTPDRSRLDWGDFNISDVGGLTEDGETEDNENIKFEETEDNHSMEGGKPQNGENDKIRGNDGNNAHTSNASDSILEGEISKIRLQYARSNASSYVECRSLLSSSSKSHGLLLISKCPHPESNKHFAKHLCMRERANYPSGLYSCIRQRNSRPGGSRFCQPSLCRTSRSGSRCDKC